jgi:hypothetical protein
MLDWIHRMKTRRREEEARDAELVARLRSVLQAEDQEAPAEGWKPLLERIQALPPDPARTRRVPKSVGQVRLAYWSRRISLSTGIVILCSVSVWLLFHSAPAVAQYWGPMPTPYVDYASGPSEVVFKDRLIAYDVDALSSTVYPKNVSALVVRRLAAMGDADDVPIIVEYSIFADDGRFVRGFTHMTRSEIIQAANEGYRINDAYAHP